MSTVYFSLGSNRGNKEKNLFQAIVYLREYVGEIADYSSIYESEPWGFNDSEDFFNMVIKVETELPPRRILEIIKTIEERMGRVLTRDGYQSRIIDIDILLCDQLVIKEKDLQIPHLQINERNFVLFPLTDIAADIINPTCKKTFNDLIKVCKDEKEIGLFKHRSQIQGVMNF